MTMHKQINKMCQNTYYNLWNISKLRKSLSKETIKIAVNSLVTPHLDYGNALLYGVNSQFINRLQVAQNSAVRLIEGLKRHDHVSKSMKELHWLPIPARIQFKLMTTIWKILNNMAPEYLTGLVQLKPENEHNLRSNDKGLLLVPNSRNQNNFEDRAFHYSAPSLWNSLSVKLRNSKTLILFRKRLKPHLFTKFYK